jgi:hypothetical protein
MATLEWVDRFNNRRIYEHCGDMTPVELEALYSQRNQIRQQAELSPRRSLSTEHALLPDRLEHSPSAHLELKLRRRGRRIWSELNNPPAFGELWRLWTSEDAPADAPLGP